MSDPTDAAKMAKWPSVMSTSGKHGKLWVPLDDAEARIAELEGDARVNDASTDDIIAELRARIKVLTEALRWLDVWVGPVGKTVPPTVKHVIRAALASLEPK